MVLPVTTNQICSADDYNKIVTAILDRNPSLSVSTVSTGDRMTIDQINDLRSAVETLSLSCWNDSTKANYSLSQLMTDASVGNGAGLWTRDPSGPTYSGDLSAGDRIYKEHLNELYSVLSLMTHFFKTGGAVIKIKQGVGNQNAYPETVPGDLETAQSNAQTAYDAAPDGGIKTNYYWETSWAGNVSWDDEVDPDDVRSVAEVIADGDSVEDVDVKNSTAAFNESSKIKINSEKMSFSVVVGSSLRVPNAQRGEDGTSDAHHNAGSIIYELNDSYETFGDWSATIDKTYGTYSYAGLPNINIIAGSLYVRITGVNETISHDVTMGDITIDEGGIIDISIPNQNITLSDALWPVGGGTLEFHTSVNHDWTASPTQAEFDTNLKNMVDNDLDSHRVDHDSTTYLVYQPVLTDF